MRCQWWCGLMPPFIMENKMSGNKNWPFPEGSQVTGRKLPDYLAWATGSGQHPKRLLLPSIQRGFVWKPKQIVDLWDSLLRGMPIGSLMLSKLSRGDPAVTLATKETESVEREAMGLLDGQQRTLAILIGWPFQKNSTPNCLWIDLAEEGHAGSPFDIRLTTITQPFGFQRISHRRLSRHERREARKHYDKCHPEYIKKYDYELFALDPEHSQHSQPRPWKAHSEPTQFVKVQDLWEAFKKTENDKPAFLDLFKSHLADKDKRKRLSHLHEAFTRLESLEVPLILIPEHISTPMPEAPPNGAPDPLVLLFERIGRNGASLSAEDLLFSMIKQQWPEAQDLVNNIHGKIEVRGFMSATDYVMSAFRLAAAQSSDQGAQIADQPRPNPNDFHRHLDGLLGNKKSNKPLRDYLEEGHKLARAFDSLYSLLAYQRGQEPDDIGLPLLMMPHLSRGLIQVLLRWLMLDPDPKTIEDNRQKIVSFTLFWYMNVQHKDEDKASKMAFKIISRDKDTFPTTTLYEELIDAPMEDEPGLALPLMPYDKLKNILNQDASATLRSQEEIFKLNASGKPIATLKQRQLYKNFCWGRKPILLWLQRVYVDHNFNEQTQANFAGLTDEETVPYDYDHLCPQNHWGADWRNITKIPDEVPPVVIAFQAGRHDVGNCIGNLHVLESSQNRSFGDDPLALKLESNESKRWSAQDSLLYHFPEHEKLWKDASPIVDDEKDNLTWSEPRLEAFQSAIYRRAEGLYCQYYEACKHIISK